MNGLWGLRGPALCYRGCVNSLPGFSLMFVHQVPLLSVIALPDVMGTTDTKVSSLSVFSSFSYSDYIVIINRHFIYHNCLWKKAIGV